MYDPALVSILDELELRTQFEARRALSTSAAGANALGAWARARLPLEASTKTRAECVRGALVVAVGSGDSETVAILAPMWLERPRVDPSPLLAACEVSPHLALARQIAARVVEAEPTSVSLLVLASIEERSHRLAEAEALRRRAIAHAEGLADVASAIRARVELARLLILSGREVDALELVSEIDRELEPRNSRPAPLTLDARDQLVLAQVELAASGRYRRARAIDRLAEVTTSSRGVEGRAALRLLARHVASAGPALTAAEIDRVHAVLVRAKAHGLPVGAIDAIEARLALVLAPDAEREAQTIRAVASTDDGRVLVERARAVRDGGTAGPAPSARLRTDWLCMSVIAHARTRRLGDALTALRELDVSGASASVAGWTMLSRVASERALRESFVRVALRWLGDERAPLPRRGHLDLAVRLERAGMTDLAGLALARARRVHEPGAREISIQHAIRRAWSARARGETREAHRLLAAALSDARAGTGSALMSPSAPRTR